MLAQGFEGDVVGGRDVSGLELGGSADVDETDVLALSETGAQFDGGDDGVHGEVVLLVQALSETRLLAVM